MYRNKEVDEFRSFNIFIDFEILDIVDVDKDIISCGIHNILQRACQVLATLCLEYYAVPACLEGCVNDYFHSVL